MAERRAGVARRPVLVAVLLAVAALFLPPVARAPLGSVVAAGSSSWATSGVGHSGSVDTGPLAVQTPSVHRVTGLDQGGAGLAVLPAAGLGVVLLLVGTVVPAVFRGRPRRAAVVGGRGPPAVTASPL